MKVIEKILKAAKDQRISQRNLEQTAALPKNRISKWKRGTGEPSWSEVLRLARLVSLPLSYLADDQADEAPAPPEPESPVWITIRTIAEEIGGQEAVRRLLRPPGPVFGDLPARPGEPKLEPRRGTG